MVVTDYEEIAGGERKMMGLETITLVPIDVNLVEVSLLTEDERAWLNAYHARVRETLHHLLEDDARVWLERVTRAI